MDLTAPALGRMVEPSRQDRLPRPGRRASNSEPATPSCGCSHQPTTTASVPPIAHERLHGAAPPLTSVQPEPQVELSMDGDGALMTGFAPPRVVRRFETSRLSQFLDYGRQLAQRSLGSAYSVVHAADDARPVRGGPAASAFKWPEPKQDGAPSGSHAARFGTDVDWGDEALPAGIGASRSLDAELEADNAEDPYCPEEARPAPWWRGRGACCAAVLLGVVLLVSSSASQDPVVTPADDHAAGDLSVPTAGGHAPPRPEARAPAMRRAASPPPPPSEHRPVLHNPNPNPNPNPDPNPNRNPNPKVRRRRRPRSASAPAAGRSAELG